MQLCMPPLSYFYSLLSLLEQQKVSNCQKVPPLFISLEALLASIWAGGTFVNRNDRGESDAIRSHNSGREERPFLEVISGYRKKRFTSFPSPAGLTLTKLPLGRNNSVMTSLFPPRESLVGTSRLGTGNSRTFFLRCRQPPELSSIEWLWKVKEYHPLVVSFRKNSQGDQSTL